MGGHPDEPSSFDGIEPSVARIYDHLLGGSNSFQPDRGVAAALERICIGVRETRCRAGSSSPMRSPGLRCRASPGSSTWDARFGQARPPNERHPRYGESY